MTTRPRSHHGNVFYYHPFFIRYQGGAGDHVVQISAGQTIRSGVGQSFWLRKGRCALAEVPPLTAPQLPWCR